MVSGRTVSFMVVSFDEPEEVGVQPVSVGVGEAVSAGLVNLQLSAGDRCCGAFSADVEGDDLVVVAVDDQGWYIDLGQVGSEVGGGEGGDAFVGAAMSAGHALQPERVANALGDVVVAVVAEERSVGEIPVKL